jgi:hypothetical protein
MKREEVELRAERLLMELRDYPVPPNGTDFDRMDIATVAAALTAAWTDGREAAPTLKELIDWARGYEMTEAEKREQRRSFAYGNCHIENENVTKEMVDEADERLHPRSEQHKRPP